MTEMVLVCVRRGASLQELNTRHWLPTENPDKRVLCSVLVGKLWDVLDYGLSVNKGNPRYSSLLAKGLGDAGARELYRFDDAEVEALFYALAELDTRWLTEEAYEVDAFQAVPEDEAELDEVRERTIELLLFYFDHDCELYVER